MTKPIPVRVAFRAATRYVVVGECHISVYSVASHGYAQIGWQEDGKTQGTTAHRAASTFYDGPLDEGETVDHRCKNRRCVRREHLRRLSNFENARRTNGRDWPLGECAHGHPNELLAVKGRKRVCGVCNAEWQAGWRAKRRGRS